MHPDQIYYLFRHFFDGIFKEFNRNILGLYMLLFCRLHVPSRLYETDVCGQVMAKSTPEEGISHGEVFTY
jgi:hypothetical protein